MLVVLAPAGQAAAQCTPAAQAQQPGEPLQCLCRIGPVTIAAPVCAIKTESFDGARVNYIAWRNEKGIQYHIAVITPKHPRSFEGYLSRWLHNHKCTGKERQIGKPSRFEGPSGLGGIPPQVTWTGCCAAPGCYIARAIAAGNQVVELHANIGLNDKLEPASEQVFSALIAQVQLSRPLSR
jgi:hypothetical protein